MSFFSRIMDTSLPALPTEKHPFQLDCSPWPTGPYELVRMTWESVPAFFARLDMPGCYGVSRFRKGNGGLITFNARAPKKEGFPYDESERVYAGCFNVAGEALLTSVKDIIRNGCFFMFFPVSRITLFLLPPPRSPPSSVIQGSVKSEKSEGSSSGKSIVEDLDINLDAMNLAMSSEESAKTEQGEGFSCAKSIDLAEDMLERINLDAINREAQGSGKSEQKEGSSDKSIDKPQGSGKSGSGESASNESAERPAKNEHSESRSGKSIDNAEDSGKPRSTTSSSNEDEAWMLAWIKTNVLQIHGPELPKEESTPVENSSEQSSHEAPEIAIGSVEECDVHSLQCQCQRCDSNGVCLKTWSTTEDVIGYVNQLKIQGPDGVCEKRVVQEDGWYALYVRADLPGLEPCLCITTVKDRCILVYGKLPPKEVKKKRLTLGARSYLFFVQLRCSCCKFDNLTQHHADGVLRLFCKIRGPEPGPSAD